MLYDTYNLMILIIALAFLLGHPGRETSIGAPIISVLGKAGLLRGPDGTGHGALKARRPSFAVGASAQAAYALSIMSSSSRLSAILVAWGLVRSRLGRSFSY